MKKCLYCAEEIQDEAIVCKHCGRDVVNTAGSTMLGTYAKELAALRQTAAKDAKEKGARDAKRAFYFSGGRWGWGDYILSIILAPVAIYYARKAKEKLAPGDPGYREAQTAEIHGWIGCAIPALTLCVIAWALLKYY